MHPFPLKTLTALCLCSFTAVAGLAAGDADATVRALLTKQAADWDAAICRKDRAAIEANIGADFRHMDANGDVNDRTAFLTDLLSPDLTINPYTVDDLDVRIYGEIALLSGTTRMTGTYQGKPFKSHYRYVDIYRRQNGRWAVVNIQITRLREPAAP